MIDMLIEQRRRSLGGGFVSASKDPLAQATADWKAGRMKLHDADDADDAEFIPCPTNPHLPAPAMS